jgi:hypothetical protein
MLWYKSLIYKTWIETRWRFLIGLALMVCAAIGLVLTYPQVMKLLPLAYAVSAEGEIGRKIKESADIQSTYPGYIWSQWFGHNFAQMWTVFAVLLGTGSVVSQTSGGGALFTLSMPVSRVRLAGVRAATACMELLVLSLIPSLLIPVFSPAIGQFYSLSSVLIYSSCMFIGGAVFFTFAFYLQTVFTDIWRPMGIALSIAAVIGVCGEVFPDVTRYGVIGVMIGDSWFRTGAVPWIGLITCAAASALLLYGATTNIARHDF